MLLDLRWLSWWNFFLCAIVLSGRFANRATWRCLHASQSFLLFYFWFIDVFREEEARLSRLSFQRKFLSYPMRWALHDMARCTTRALGTVYTKLILAVWTFD